MRRFNTIIESANPPGINQLWIDKKRLRFFSEGKWHILGGGGGSGGGSIVEIGPNGNWYIDGDDTGRPSRGEAGPNGVDGKNGKDGTNGTDGITPHIGNNKHWFIGTVDTGILAEGTNGKDGLDGKDGLNGANGIDGTSAGFGESIATAESVSNNAPAEVTIEASGPDTAKIFTFHFKIPKGKDGSGGSGGTGVDGKTPVFEAGTVTTGAAGSSAVVTVIADGVDASGNPKYKVNFTIPKGDKGDRGTDGQDGATPEIGANGNWFINGVDTTKPSRGEKGERGEAGVAGTTTYANLSDKPSINNVELSGNKTLAQLGIQAAGNYATETYVTESINAAIGSINTLLDTINGEII